MSGNSFGKVLRLTTFGESHGVAIGGILDGCPAGLSISEAEIQAELDLRKPGGSKLSTSRKESDEIKILSGVFEGVTTGTPIGFMIANKDARSADYGNLAEVFRPGHGDWSYFRKYNGIRDYRGGGRSSGRETACRVAAGAIAKRLLGRVCGAQIYAGCIELGGLAIHEEDIDMQHTQQRPYFAASNAIVAEWDRLVAEARRENDTLGGIVRIVAKNIPPGLGEPVFDKLDATLAAALMSVGAVKGIEVGAGFHAARSKGSLNNDAIYPAREGNLPHFDSNNAGGILAGISTGQDIVLQAAVKPIASVPRQQNTIDKDGNAAKVLISGRHDLSAIPRIIPVLSAMTALVLADALLLQKRMDIFS